jgi:hypothetical protein
MKIVEDDDFHHIYATILYGALEFSTLYAKMKMLDDFSFTLVDPTQSLINYRKNWAWALHEGINRLSFDNARMQNPGTAHFYRPNWARKLEKEGGTFCYSYGESYADQVQHIISLLKSKSEREAIITMWDPNYTDKTFRKTFPRRPCTLTLHFYFFKNQLNCSCNMRTVDIMNMLPYDVFHHTLLQRFLASVLEVELGKFHFHATFAYYQKKRDITGSVRNTYEALTKLNPPPVSPDSEFGHAELHRCRTTIEYLENNHPCLDSVLYDKEISTFGQNYVKALLYYNIDSRKRKQHKEFLGEFEVIKR